MAIADYDIEQIADAAARSDRDAPRYGPWLFPGECGDENCGRRRTVRHRHREPPGRDPS